MYNYPKFYAHSLPEDFVHENANVSLAIEGHHVTISPWKNLLTMTSLAGQQFLSFAKYTTYGQGWPIIMLILYTEFPLFVYKLII